MDRRRRAHEPVLPVHHLLLGDDGISDFDGLHSGKVDAEVLLYAFDVPAMGGDDLTEGARNA